MADNRSGEVTGNIAGGLIGGGLIGMLDGPSPILDIVGSNIGSAIGGAVGGKMPGGKKRMAGQIDPRLLMMSMNMSTPNPNTDAFIGGMQQTHSY